MPPPLRVGHRHGHGQATWWPHMMHLMYSVFKNNKRDLKLDTNVIVLLVSSTLVYSSEHCVNSMCLFDLVFSGWLSIFESAGRSKKNHVFFFRSGVVALTGWCPEMCQTTASCPIAAAASEIDCCRHVWKLRRLLKTVCLPGRCSPARRRRARLLGGRPMGCQIVFMFHLAQNKGWV